MNKLITFTQTVKELKLANNRTLHTCKKYKPFVHGKHFDIVGYNNYLMHKEKIYVYSTFFVEYIKYLHNIKYDDICEKAGCSVASLSLHQFGSTVALSILDNYRELIIPFCNYYGYKIKVLNNSRVELKKILRGME